MTGPGTLARARAALRSPDFRRLFQIRLVSQFSDGLFQASLVASVVFSPENQNTALGLAKATALISLPYSVLGPFTGVFIDRWSRRRIMVVAPWLRTAVVGLVLFDPEHLAVPFFAGALLVLSVNRFFLATAQAVVPRLVPTEDLLVANSMATVGGTVALLLGVFAGGQIAEAVGSAPIVIAAGVGWVVASLLASRSRSDLAPHALPQDPGLLTHELRRVMHEFRDGLQRLTRTPRALGPIASITLDQIGQGVILTLSLVVFREKFEEGVGSFSWLIGAGGLGVFAGLATVGILEQRFRKEHIVAGAFLAGGLALVAVSFKITGTTVLIASFAVGLTFAWKKVPVDTMVQESLPDGYRGRVFAVYDVLYNLARLAAALIAIPLFPRLGAAGTLAIVGAVFILWTPVLPRWLAVVPELRLRFVEGSKAEEWPRAVVWGGVEETVEVERSWLEEQDGIRRRRFRLVLDDGTVLDVSRTEPDGQWRLDAEIERPRT
jgi:predicted MFS family arabinose efflux permease